jgi:hypothetical protein
MNFMPPPDKFPSQRQAGVTATDNQYAPLPGFRSTTFSTRFI